jgi:hypothetical protein
MNESEQDTSIFSPEGGGGMFLQSGGINLEVQKP